MTFKGTPQPWVMNLYNPTGGYDCMTGAIKIGPVTLDGHNYGQKSCAPITSKQLEQMTADARVIRAAPLMQQALIDVVTARPGTQTSNAKEKALLALKLSGYLD